MNDNNDKWDFLEKSKREAGMHSDMAGRIGRLMTGEGKIIIIDNFISEYERQEGAFDNTFIGYYKNIIPKKIILGGTSDTEPSGNDIGVVVEFEKKSKILLFGEQPYGLPSKNLDKEFYKKAKARFVDNPEMKGTVHYNSNLIIVRDIIDRNFADSWLLQRYNTNLKEAGF